MPDTKPLLSFVLVTSFVCTAATVAAGCGDDSSTTDIELDASNDAPTTDTSIDGTTDASTDAPSTDAPATDGAKDAAPDAPAQLGLDPTFGNAGVVTLPGSIDSEDAVRVRRQPDGKLVVLAWNQSHYQIELARLEASGAIDTTFGSGGHVMAWSAEEVLPISIALQSDGKIVALGRGLDIAASTVLKRFDAAGNIDATFGTGGTVLVPSSLGFSVALQADGKIVIGASERTAGNAGWQFLVVRLTTTGALDTTFHTTGRATTTFGLTPLPTDDAEGLSVAIDPNGKIVLAGEYRPLGGNLSAAVARYNSDGSPDTTFATTGKTTITAPGAPNETQAYAVAVQSDAKVVVGGGSSAKMFIARFNADGTPDTAFGGAANGMLVSSAIPGQLLVSELAIAPSGAIYASVGRQTSNGYVARLTSAGVFDTTFGTTGYAMISAASGFGGVAALPDGTVLATGSNGALNGQNAIVVHHHADGGVDNTFGTLGEAVINAKATKDTATSVIAQPDGKIAVAGNSAFPGSSATLRRYTAAGAADTTFASGQSYQGLPSYPRSIALDPLGGLVAVGGFSSFEVTRTTPAGLADTTFGTSQGRATFTMGAGDVAFPTCVRVDGTGRAIVAGFSTPSGGGAMRFAVARLTTAGVPDTTFASTGKIATPIGTGDASALALAIQVDGKPVVVGFATGAGGRQDFAVARYATTGALDSTFVGDAAGSGIVTTDTSATDQFERARAVAIASDGKIVVAGNAGASGPDMYSEADGPHFGPSSIVVARYLADGHLDTTFGTGGKTILTTAGAEQLAHAVQIMPDGKIVIAGRRYTAPREDGILIRLQSSGAVDSTFATAGTYALGLGNASAFFDLAAQADGKLIAAGRIHTTAGGYDFAFVRVVP
jgi:uncharacterized delta-60 repeat protein